jgi:hypothetical protein
MLHYYKFHADALDPRPALEAYVKRPAGQGWPESCPPMRQANAFGWDILSNFELTFVKDPQGTFGLTSDQGLVSDWHLGASDDEDEEAQDPSAAQVQHAAWFWDPNQTLPHPIGAEVYEAIKHQVKVSSYLFLKTDPNQVLLMTDVPNQPPRPYRALSAVIETDWYPASYPWHCVLELDPTKDSITIEKGEPIARVIPVRRDTYFAREMSPIAFTEYFQRSQGWLAQHGHGAQADADDPAMVDIRRSYRKRALPSRFVTDPLDAEA